MNPHKKLLLGDLKQLGSMHPKIEARFDFDKLPIDNILKTIDGPTVWLSVQRSLTRHVRLTPQGPLAHLPGEMPVHVVSSILFSNALLQAHLQSQQQNGVVLSALRSCLKPLC